MKRAVVYACDKPLRLTDYPVPTPPPKGAVVRLTYSGVCHSDVHFWEEFDLEHGIKDMLKKEGVSPLEIAPGHEMAGIVEALGTDAGPELSVGDSVVIYPWLACLKCHLCLGGRPNYCPIIPEKIGLIKHGGFATHVVVPIVENTVMKLPPGLSPDVACMLPCSGITTYHAVLSTRDTLVEMVALKGHANLLVIGAGGLGLWCIQMAKNVLPEGVAVFSADQTEEKLSIATDAGADGTIVWSDGADEEELRSQTREKSGVGKTGFDAIIDLVGTDATSSRAYDLLTNGGIQITVGLFGGKISLNLAQHAVATKTVKGILVGTPKHLKDVLKLVAEKKLKPPPTHFFPLEEVTDVMIRLREGKINGRAILKL